MSSWCQRSDRNRQTVWSQQDATVTQITTRYNQLCKRASLNGQHIGLKQMDNRSRRPHQVKIGQQKMRKMLFGLMSLDFCRSIQVVGSVTESVFVDHVNTVHDHSESRSHRITCHVTKLWSSHSYQISVKGIPSWMLWFASWTCSKQFPSNCVMLSCQYGPESVSSASRTLLNRCYKMLKAVQKAKGSPIWY